MQSHASWLQQEVFMSNSTRIFFILTFVIFAVVVLCLFVPNPFLFKSFLIVGGGLLIVGVGLSLTIEFSKFRDLKHRQKMQQELRELELQKRKQEQFLFGIQHKRTTRARYP